MKQLTKLSVVISAGMIAFGLTACGDDVTEQVVNNTIDNVGAVDSKDSLPECNKEKAGQTAYVMEDNAFFGCDGEKWRQLDGSTVSVGDNICTSTALPDDEGFKITCNGDSIGVVRNGADGTDGVDGKDGKDGIGKDGVDGKDGTNGKDGSDGKDGAGCKIKGASALTATIACGTETFTMDLTGYVTGDEEAECDAATDSDCAENLGEIQIAGQSQKGPFVTGADVTAYELLNGRTLKQTGKTFGGKIDNADGSFNIKSVKLSSQFAYLVADGFYRNEVTGDNSAAPIKLRALTNLKGRKSANINLVTHLEYERVSSLVTKQGLSVAKAKKQAETEIFAAFGIDGSNFTGYAEDFSILNEGDGNAALLAISVLLQGDRTEAELTNLLASLSVDIGDSSWDNLRDRASVADWAFAKEFSKDGLESIRNNISNWKDGSGNKIATAVPAFEKHVKNFWHSEYKLGECSSKNANEIKSAAGNKYSAHYATTDSVSVEGEALTRFICAANGSGETATYAWREATDYEKDVAKLPAPTANAIASGMINTNFVYVVEDGKWRRGTELDAAIGTICSAKNIKDFNYTVASTDTTWYICEGSWRKATEAEADTANFAKPETSADSVKQGRVNKAHIFVYEDGTWRRGTDLDLLLEKPCVANSKDSIHKTDTEQFYTCSSDPQMVDGIKVLYTWRESKVTEADTYGWGIPTAKADNDSARYGQVNKNLVYVYEDNEWRYGTVLDADKGLGPCIKDSVGKVHNLYGKRDVNAWYKCVDDEVEYVEGYRVSTLWRKATSYEMDVNYLVLSGTSENFAIGPVTKKYYYVQEPYGWRPATEQEQLMRLECTESENNVVSRDIKDNWYKCTGDNSTVVDTFEVEYTWRTASAMEKDTAGWGDKVPSNNYKVGNVNKNVVYVYENGTWRYGTALDKYFGRGCTNENAQRDTTTQTFNDRYYICESTPNDTVPYQWVDAGDWYNETVLRRKYCTDKKIGELMAGEKSGQNYICTSDASWQIPANKVDSTLGGCREIIKDSIGNVDESYWYCEQNYKGEWAWRLAEKMEYDTYRWDKIYNTPKDGDLREGNVTRNSWYVFDEELGGWFDHSNEITFDYKLRGCTKRRAENRDTLRALDDDVYACMLQGTVYRWKMITDATIIDTYGIDCPAEGRLYRAPRSGNKYYCEEEGRFVRANLADAIFNKICKTGIEHEVTYKDNKYKCGLDNDYWTDSLDRQLIIDERDSEIYPFVTINDQTWLAKNLNYAYLEPTSTLDSSSFCYQNRTDNCAKYGRLYLWSAITSEPGICPKGWRIPSRTDWRALINYATPNGASNSLKSQRGWSNYNGGSASGDGRDYFYFTILPAGSGSGDKFYFIGTDARFWSNTELSTNKDKVYFYSFNSDPSKTIENTVDKTAGFSVRCIKEEN